MPYMYGCDPQHLGGGGEGGSNPRMPPLDPALTSHKINSFAVTNLVSKRPNSVNRLEPVIIRHPYYEFLRPIVTSLKFEIVTM